MQMNTRRLECAWLLREAAWALKTYADRIERAVVSIDPKRQAQAEAGAKTWADRARQRLAKFSAARRKYLGIGASVVLRGVNATDALRILLDDLQEQIHLYADGSFRVARMIEQEREYMQDYPRWHAGQPPKKKGRYKIFCGPGHFEYWWCTGEKFIFPLSNLGPFGTMPKAWRPA